MPLEQDGLNPRLIVPGPTEEPVSIAGRVLDRDKFLEMRSKYYRLRGWDPETGLQTRGRLEALGMADLVAGLEETDHIR